MPRKISNSPGYMGPRPHHPPPMPPDTPILQLNERPIPKGYRDLPDQQKEMLGRMLRYYLDCVTKLPQFQGLNSTPSK